MSIFHQVTSLLKNKRFLLTLLVLIGVGAYFWSQSRYPQLDHKALMGAETQFEAIGFDTLLTMPEKAGLARRIYVNSANWMWTNRKGMTFGVIFGAILMTMLPFLNGLKFSSRFANSVLGVLMGSPLGLCVNCSTLVAHGLYAAGARPETMLAMMVSSPTLNVVVLTMLFSLFPPWLAFLKIGTTATFILVVIPLLVRWLNPSVIAVKPYQPDFFSRTVERQVMETACATATEQCDESETTENWFGSAQWVVTNLFRNLWYLIKITVPLMILAGILGAALVTIIPLESLVNNLPEGRLMSWVSLAALAIIGLLLPVPMTFDVIAIAVLYNAGMPIKYVAVLLFTLGVFSVYPFMTLWRNMSRQVAFGIFGALVVLGVASGVFANRYHAWDLVRQQLLMLEPFTKGAPPPDKPAIDRTSQGRNFDELLPELEKSALRPESVSEVSGLKVGGVAFNSPQSPAAESQGTSWMRRYNQSEFGITEHENYSLLKLDMRYSVGRGIASGDVNGDGWTDFVVTSDVGLALYLNRQGKSFVQARLEIPQLNDFMVTSAALVDLNNDGWLDLWLTTLQRGNYVIYNKEGRFTSENLKRIQNQPDAVLTSATAFGDLDRDGKLDIALGNVSAIGKSDLKVTYKSSRNVWLRQTEGNGFSMQPLEGMDGESLTSLMSDFNGDGNLDLLIGNDLLAPDMIYSGDGKGGLRLVTKDDGLIPRTSNFTMSISSADLDNDLKPELLFGSVALRDAPGQKGQARRLTPSEVCAELPEGEQRTRCEQFYNFRQIAGHAMSPGEIWECKNLPTQSERDACVAYKIIQNASEAKKEKLCDSIPSGWEYHSFQCRAHFAATEPFSKEDLENGIPQAGKTSILLKRNAAGNLEDVGKSLGLNETGWTWNAKFADLDNDGWQDLFVANGWVRRFRTETNYFYRNNQGKGFEDMTEESGLTSYLNTLAYTYIDIDNDGDLDIIVVPTVGPLSVYINQTRAKQSIAFELRDGRGNHYGVGSKIIINYGDGQHQMREIQASGGYISFDAPVAYFGLGDEQAIKSVEIEWSTGEKSVIEKEFKAGARYIVTRPK